MAYQIPRRTFLKNCAAFGCAATGTLFTASDTGGAAEPPLEGANIIGPREGFSPQVGTLVSMLTWMRGAVTGAVQGLTTKQLDYLHDAKANTIGALLLHLVATERHYQSHTFENRQWGDWDDETKRRWDVAGGLGAEARQTIKGHELTYYLTALEEVRAKTVVELGKRDDDWLMQVDPGWPWGPTNNYCKWFHVCEHESHHNGQIKWLIGRLPGKEASEE